MHEYGSRRGKILFVDACENESMSLPDSASLANVHENHGGIYQPIVDFSNTSEKGMSFTRWFLRQT